MTEAKLSTTQLQELCSRCPFNRWLALAVLDSGPGEITMELPWKRDLLSSPELNLVHGGVIAALIDTACGYAAASLLGHGVPTVDLTTDYHRSAVEGPIRAKAKVVKRGHTLSFVECTISDCEGRHVASGRTVVMSSRVTNPSR